MREIFGAIDKATYALICVVVFVLFWVSIVLGIRCVVQEDEAKYPPPPSEWK